MAIEIEESGDLKSLPYAGKTEEEFQISRKWSYFKNVDPVAFINENKVRIGKPEIALDFMNHIFIFENEENKKIFQKNPKNFIKEIP